MASHKQQDAISHDLSFTTWKLAYVIIQFEWYIFVLFLRFFKSNQCYRLSKKPAWVSVSSSSYQVTSSDLYYTDFLILSLRNRRWVLYLQHLVRRYFEINVRFKSIFQSLQPQYQFGAEFCCHLLSIRIHFRRSTSFPFTQIF
jgi:hypothetical protein